MKSLRGQLAFFWILLLTVSVALAAVMVGLYRSSAGAQLAQAQAIAEQACRSIATRYAKSLPDDSGSPPRLDLLHVLLQLVLIETPHVEGGVWQGSGGFLAYAYPTYEGSSVKRDVPPAEQPFIMEVAQQAARRQALQTDTIRGSREALIVSACPLQTPAGDLAAWTMTRTQSGALAALNNLRAGLGALMLVVLASGIWLGAILWRGLRHVRRIETTLAQASADGDAVPELPKTGVRELDRIVDGFNRYRTRFEAGRVHLLEASRQRARDQRLAALGRMTGALAHEIRNPIAAMRLKAENALAVDDPARHASALRTMVGQIDRLEGLVQSLLALVQPVALTPWKIELRGWLDERAANVTAKAIARKVRIGVVIDERLAAASAVFDPVHLARAIDSLLDNAVRHAAQGGRVTLSAHKREGLLARCVDDDGEGIPPDLQAHLFEPFATGRADGTGLGLALAREVAIAHGGDLRHVALDPGTRFELELPWRTS